MKQLPDLVIEWLNDVERDFWEGIKILSKLTINRTLIRNLSKKENKYNRDKLYNEVQKHGRKALPKNDQPKTFYPKITSVLSGHLMNINTDQVKLDPPVDPSTTIPLDTTAGDDSGQCSSHDEPHPATEDVSIDELPTDHTGEGILESIRMLSEWKKPELPVDPPKELPIDPINPEDAKSVEELEISYSKMFNKKGMLSNSLRDFAEDDNAGRKDVLDRMADIDKAMQSVDAKIRHFKEHGSLPALTEPTTPAVKTVKEVILPDDPVKITRMINNERSNISKLRRRIKRGHPDPEKLAALEANLQKKNELVNELERRLGGSGS